MKKILLFPLVLALASCATGEKFSNLSVGMSKSQVVSTIGKPDGDAINDNVELLSYSNRMMSGWSYDKADYQVILKDNKVIEYGVVNVRQDNGAALSRALTAQQSLLIYQQQQALSHSYRTLPTQPTTTNCDRYGNSVTCRSY
ncbi:hypothetical protein [Tatumella sp. OPLPL6]|uniref:hypothetical protein n=1 Tax=Tatumella sp. OPLPL6 TaxID=1928657 RepID=UPI00117D8FC7|nr:hypothetical protein [Tatumella sp. OPLPL6]